jgi:putative membrane protein
MHLPEYFAGDIVATVAFGVVAILLIVLGYVTFDKLTPKLDFNELLAKGNLAVGVVIGSFILGVCFVVGRVVSAILGG